MSRRIDEVSFWVLSATALALPLIFTTQTADVFGTPKITLIRLTAMVLLFLGAARVAASGKIRVPSGPLFIVAMVFLATMIISTILSVHVPTSVLGLRKRFFGLSTYVPLIIILFSAVTLKWDYRRLHRFAWMLAAGAALTSLIGLAQTLGSTWPTDLKFAFSTRAYATIGNPNFLGIYLVMALPITASLISAESISWRKGLAAVISISIVCAIITTKSSGAMMGLVVVTVAYLIFANAGKLRNLKILAIVAVLVTIVSILGFFLIFQPEAKSRSSRNAAWQASLRVINKRPWFGTGPDTGRFTIGKEIRPQDGAPAQEVFEDAHNVLLTHAATSGLWSAALFVGLVALGITAGIKAAGTTGGPAAAILYGTSAAMLGYTGATIVNPDNIVALSIFWLLLGVAGGRRWDYGELSVSAPAAVPFIVPIALAAILGAVASIYPFSAEVRLQRADNEQLVEPMLAEYELAEGANPYYDHYSIRITDRLTPLIGSDRAGINARALEAADRAIAKSPLEADNYVIKGTIFRNLAKSGGDRHLLEDAAKLYKKALRLNPRNLFAMRNLAESYFLMGDRRKAARWLDRYLAIQDDPEIKELKETWGLGKPQP
ncbi:MAG TPA: tetratricopeptide repeat protein [Actinobacteria bacterium]|nr:tetratricopeptide repeat protein [Actinomycetota bacterium]